ncbi:hypothetical protein P1X15_31090 [Runella sp. MFBS21]|uniref:hypothetical protein n=1 Tax=Runella sp. MFBS21 TaxID=3034018 RepID=UPI0023F7C69C|nr:hypothetical protein [Runella sp. MFBS21]MDF7822103.1 hypothetical protein [Runella sp. MFBS21]
MSHYQLSQVMAYLEEVFGFSGLSVLFSLYGIKLNTALTSNIDLVEGTSETLRKLQVIANFHDND